QARLDLNHPGVLRAIIDSDPELAAAADEIFDLLITKDVPGLHELGQRLTGVQPTSIQALLSLATLYGGTEVIDRAREILPALPALHAALDDLETLVRALPGHEFSVDLADMGSGYGYHSGVVFSIYAHGWHDALVRGG